MENGEIHVHQFETTVVPATCMERGYTLHRCACGYEHKDQFTALVDHQFEVREETAPSCQTAGERKLRCRNCSQEKTQTLPALGHAWSQPAVQQFATCTEEGSQLSQCSRCGETRVWAIPVLEHKISKATKNAQGKKEYFCEHCGQPMKKKLISKKALRAILVTAASVVVVAGIAVGGYFFLKPRYHYNTALEQIDDEDYAEAKEHLKQCKNFKDSEELLEKFVTKYEQVEIIEKDYDENGKVTKQEVLKEIYEYDESGNMIVMIKYNAAGNLSWYGEYDKNGNKTLSETYDSKGNLEYYCEYEYDENGNEINCNQYDEDGKLIVQYIYEYDEQGNLTFRGSYDGYSLEKDYEYTYDENGNLILYKGYDVYGELSDQVEYAYDEKGNRILRKAFDGEGNLIDHEEYAYDEKGNQVLVRSYDTDGSLTGYSEYEYDKDGNQTLTSYYASDGTLEHYAEGKYDQNGNNIFYAMYDAEGQLSYCCESEYDQKGNQTLDKYYSGPNKQLESQYKWTYDEDGNMISYEGFVAGGKVSSSASYRYSKPIVYYFPEGVEEA